MYLDPCDEYREKCAALAEEEKAKYYKPPERDTRQEEAHRGQGTTGADIGQEEPGETNPFPSHIMTGAAGHFSAVLAQVMESPRHFFFMVYLACIGIVMANKISLATELKPQPRLYLVLLGESADDRKSTAISKTVDFFISALTEFNVCFGVGSAEGLQKILDKKKSLLLVYDELKAFVGKAKADGSILLPATCTLFESNRFENHTKDKELKIMDAYLSIVAASTIATYERCWDSSFQDIGMTNRLFIVPGTGKRKNAIPLRVPDESWQEMKVLLSKILQRVENIESLSITNEAKALYENWYLSLEQSMHTKRLDTYALRFMILLAVNEGKDHVDGIIAQNVIDLMNWQLHARRLHDPVDADNTIAKIEEKIRRVLTANPVKETVLKRKVHYTRIGSWVYTQAIKNLTIAKEIIYEKNEKLWKMV